MEPLEILILILVGIFAGFLNTVAGGGSLITMPLMIFMGLPPVVANASNRLALLFQNIFAVAGFKSKGISAYPYSLWLGISASFGAIIGSKIAVDIDGQVFNRILAVVMIGVVLITIFNPLGKGGVVIERMATKNKFWGIVVFFFIGIYGGFIQAGVGFLVISALLIINGFSLVKTNSAKVFVILCYTIAALGVFIYEGVVNWQWGLTLAIGNATGGWIGSRWSVKKGDKWIKRILIVSVGALAIKLWFF